MSFTVIQNEDVKHLSQIHCRGVGMFVKQY